MGAVIGGGWGPCAVEERGGGEGTVGGRGYLVGSVGGRGGWAGGGGGLRLTRVWQRMNLRTRPRFMPAGPAMAR